jgi:hypothetical protein
VNIERTAGRTRIEISAHELRLLRRALERALMIDIPAQEQAEVVAFTSRTLEALPPLEE